MVKIILTGPESSGKTTLCEKLSDHFKTTCNKEYSRKYINTLNRNYNYFDLVKIAKGQFNSEKNNIILDTDLITIKIWSKFKYNNCDDWIINQINKQRLEKRFYLLCKPDIVWEYDPIRENPKNREELFYLYKKELEILEHNYFIIEGENRLYQCISKISSIIS